MPSNDGNDAAYRCLTARVLVASDCREHVVSGVGPFLFDSFSAADAFYDWEEPLVSLDVLGPAVAVGTDVARLVRAAAPARVWIVD